jgi:hypothetical protein
MLITGRGFHFIFFSFSVSQHGVIYILWFVSIVPSLIKTLFIKPLNSRLFAVFCNKMGHFLLYADTYSCSHGKTLFKSLSKFKNVTFYFTKILLIRKASVNSTLFNRSFWQINMVIVISGQNFKQRTRN